MLLSAFFTACVACAWWAGILSVFPVRLSSLWLYTGMIFFSLIVSFIVYRGGRWGIAPVFAVGGAVLWLLRDAAVSVFLCGSAEGVSVSAAAAVMSLPLLWLWLIVLRHGKGKLLAGLVMAVPYITAACAGYFPSALASWLLFLSGGLYYAFLALRRPEGMARRSILTVEKRMTHTIISFTASAGAVVLMICISIFAGRSLDNGREVEGSFYQSTRAWLRSDVIGGAERFANAIKNTKEAQTESEDSSRDQEDILEEEQAQEGEREAQDEPADISQIAETEQSAEAFGEKALESGSAMSDLKAVGSFVPDDDAAGVRGYILTEKPTETVYFPLRYGIRYQDDSWSEEEAGVLDGYADSLQTGNGADTSLSLAQKRDYTEYPDLLDRLETLCEDWDKGSLRTVAEQIDKTLSSMAVYDTAPGPTPSDQNFPEYFLFENKRGFCVHFATTATLLYRMCGYPARYAEGYAIPPSAFRRQENGDYSAVIDGSMGHAWCQVFDEESGEWLDMEHTPPSSGIVPKSNGGLLDGTRGWKGKAVGIVKTILSATGVLGCSILFIAGITFLQASVRRKRLGEKLCYHADGSGILTAYDIVFETARFDKKTGKRRSSKERLSEDVLEKLKDSYPKIKPEEWNGFYVQVMRGMFDRPLDTEKKRKEWESACRFLRTFVLYAKEDMSGWERVLYRYVYCLDPLPYGGKIKTQKGDSINDTKIDSR